MQEWFLKWLKEKTLYRYVVTELDKSGKRHLHACFVWMTPIAGNKIKDTVWTYGYMKYQKDESNRRFSIKVNVMYDDKWYQEYLSKDENREVLDNVWASPDVIGEFYPTEEVQKACQIIGQASQSRDSNLHMCEMFREWVDEHGIEYDAIAAGEWLNRFYIDRCLSFDRKKWKEQHELLIRYTWNRWRITDWQRKLANEHGTYQGGGFESLGKRKLTVFKDDTIYDEKDADHIILSSTQTQGQRTASTRSGETDQSSVYQAEEDDEVQEECDEGSI